MMLMMFVVVVVVVVVVAAEPGLWSDARRRTWDSTIYCFLYFYSFLVSQKINKIKIKNKRRSSNVEVQSNNKTYPPRKKT